jgi:ATP-dependent metalloprotease
VVQLLRDSHARVTKLLTRHSQDLHTLSADLLQRETLTGDEIRVTLKMPPASKPTPPASKKKSSDAADGGGGVGAKDAGEEAKKEKDGDGDAIADGLVGIPGLLPGIEPVDSEKETKVTA